MLQTFTIPSLGRQIDAKASFFRYESGSAGGLDESLRVYADGQDLGTYLPGDAVRLPVPASRWNITPVNPALVSTVRLGIATVETARLVGNVRVIDSGADKTEALAQFLNSTRVAAQAAAVGLSVLVAGARRVAIKRVQIAAGSTEAVFFGYGSGAPGTVLSSVSANNKRVGGPGSSATVYSATSVVSTPTPLELPGYIFGGRVYAQAYVTLELALTTPIILQPGQCFLVNGAVINREICGNFDFEEL